MTISQYSERTLGSELYKESKDAWSRILCSRPKEVTVASCNITLPRDAGSFASHEHEDNKSTPTHGRTRHRSSLQGRFLFQVATKGSLEVDRILHD